MTIFSVDRQKKDGFPQLAHDFKDLLMSADGIIISFAEHNSSYSAAFKNIFDWISRFEGNLWYSKPMLLLATNDGDRGAKTVLEQAHKRIARKNPYKIPIFSLPNFQKNFCENKGILDSKLESQKLWQYCRTAIIASTLPCLSSLHFQLKWPWSSED